MSARRIKRISLLISLLFSVSVQAGDVVLNFQGGQRINFFSALYTELGEACTNVSYKESSSSLRYMNVPKGIWWIAISPTFSGRGPVHTDVFLVESKDDETVYNVHLPTTNIVIRLELFPKVDASASNELTIRFQRLMGNGQLNPVFERWLPMIKDDDKRWTCNSTGIRPGAYLLTFYHEQPFHSTVIGSKLINIAPNNLGETIDVKLYSVWSPRRGIE